MQRIKTARNWANGPIEVRELALIDKRTVADVHNVYYAETDVTSSKYIVLHDSLRHTYDPTRKFDPWPKYITVTEFAAVPTRTQRPQPQRPQTNGRHEQATDVSGILRR